MKSIRNILNIPAACRSRISNAQVIQIANRILYKDRNDEDENQDRKGSDAKNRYLIASSQLRVRAVTLLGHIIRTEDENDHMKKVTMNIDLTRFRRCKRRVGRPRFSWLEKTMEKTYK